MSKLKVLMLTRLFPSRAFPSLGTFCMERARALAKHVDLRVMVPTPWFPRGLVALGSWGQWASVESEGRTEEGIRVTYPRYLQIPKIATFTQGPLMVKSVAHDFRINHSGWTPDVIDAHFAYPDGYAAVHLARSLGCASVVTCHGADLRLYPELALTRAQLGWTMREADRVISVSSDLKRRSLDLGCPEENAVFLCNGVDPCRFQLRTKSESRARLGLPQEGRIAVYVGYLIDRKNQSLVIRALARIRQRGQTPPLLVLVGSGPNRKKLEKEAAELGLQDLVLFAGQRNHAEVASWMGAADWLLLSSDYEGWATVYFEAMACGRPVLTSRVNSAADAISKPDYGCVVEPYTAEAFASAIIAASAREYDEDKIRAHAEAHSWANWADQANAVFEQAIRSKSLRCI
ncbi:glycosyltransferase [Niveibacterium terrae]|uniref:glycosyltransferase n=1 Tax=Niveibacterium terrae TaxID=3373598 RepID=UPI003A8FF147